MNLRMHSILALFAVLSIATLARAQTVSATLSKERVYVGDELIYSVVIEGGNAQSLPRIDFPEGVTGEFSGQSQRSSFSSQIVGGQRRQVQVNEIVFAYRVRARRAGPLTIPSAAVTLDNGQTLETDPVRFEALLPEPSTDFVVDVELPRSTMYVGETLRATVTWTITQNVDDWTFDTTPIPDSIRVEPSDRAPPAPSGRVAEFEWFGRQANASIEQIFGPGGATQIRLQFHLLVSPTETGTFTLGPIRVVFDRFSGRSAFTRAYSESDPLTIEVLPLPTEGRPAGYTGLIGAFTLRTMATPTSANVGDPLMLRAELSGSEPMSGADTLPDLAEDPRFRDAFRVSGEGWTEERPRERGLRVFTTTLRALTPDVKSVPAITLHTFDPEAGVYRSVQSDPIQLDIRAVREATIADAVMAPGARPGVPASDARPTLSPADPAFWAPPTPEQIRSAEPFDLREAIRSPLAVVTLGAGPAVLGASALVLAFSRRAADPGHRRRRALRRAEHLTIRQSPADGARAAVAEMLNADPNAIAASDVDRLDAHAGVRRTLREAIAPEETPGAGSISPKDTRLAIRALRRGLGTGTRGAAR